ncbi:DUF5057 domain-containing protein [Tepidibacter sp. Z1-5]|uniref:DUF5057 domain-containing protein n=1 Tax=Tepidibacter sp. Z1-5 TaxID=3134138 RepID=UPI0030BB64EE
MKRLFSLALVFIMILSCTSNMQIYGETEPLSDNTHNLSVGSDDEIITYLSDMNWKSATTGSRTVQKNKNIIGNPIKLNGKTYEKGIGTHANSTIIYDLNSECKRFKATIGLDDGAGRDKWGNPRGSIRFSVYGDENKIYESGVFRCGTQHEDIDLDVRGIKELKLVVDDVDDNYFDWSDWADARVITANTKKFNVLEIQPNRKFELTPNMFTMISEKINIEQMSIREFIGKVDKINGKYDMIYIGNNGTPTYTENEGGDGNNDITDKRAKELIEFIDSGQLIIIKDNIFSTNSLKNTKLYNNLKTNTGRKNVHLTSNIAKENIKDLYNSCTKKPIFRIIDKPKEYGGDHQDPDSYNDTKVMKFKYNLENLNITDNNPNSMTVKLYLDINGDGLFKQDEMVKKSEPKLNGKGFILDYRLSEKFTGLMPWKLEVEDDITKAKAYKIGYPAYKGDKIKIRVLQIIPVHHQFTNKTNLLSIKNNKQFEPPLNTDVYDVDVTEMPVSLFNQYYPNKLPDGRETQLNGNYDMIIFGFADKYNWKDLYNQPAIDGVREFINTGQSVMFTHDTTGIMSKDGRDLDFAPNITENFKDDIGFNNIRTLSGKTKMRGRNADIDWGAWGTKLTYQFNKGLITEYPYKLKEKLVIAETHDQYWQLDLEDEDVVPWYTLYSRRYHPRNYYYTFSKGNITYSGTGHSKPGGEEEQRLFLNTIFKASKGANHAPTLRVINIEEDKIISKSQEKLKFSFIADDIDGNLLSGDVYINDKKVKNYSVQDRNIENNKPVNVVITKEQLQSLIGNKERFTIKIVVKDSKGAIAEERRTLKYLEIPALNLSIDKEQKYLVGDIASVELQAATKKTSDNLDTGIKDINFSMNYDQNAIQIDGSDSWSLKDIIFSPDPKPEVQKNSFKFKLKEKGNHIVNNILSYKISNFSNLETQKVDYSYPISVRLGIIDVKVLNNDETSFGTAAVTVTKDGKPYGSFNTDTDGFISLEACPSGQYEVSVQYPSGFIANGSNTRNFELNFDNPKQTVEFKLGQSARIFKHGMFVNKEIQKNLYIAEGFSVDSAIDFKIYDKNPDIRLTLDQYVDKAEFTLYKVDSNSDILSPVSGDIKVYEVQYDSDGKEDFKSLLNKSVKEIKTIVDLRSISGQKKLKIQIPESTTFENHYILEYNIDQKASVSSVLRSTVKINNLEENNYDLKVVEVPILE